MYRLEQKELPVGFVYHVVTQHAMQKGQVFVFDTLHPNGVRARADAHFCG